MFSQDKLKLKHEKKTKWRLLEEPLIEEIYDKALQPLKRIVTKVRLANVLD